MFHSQGSEEAYQVVLGDGRDKDNEKVRIPLQDECSFTLKAATEREKSRNIHGYVSVD